jgi:hypothetical protein
MSNWITSKDYLYISVRYYASKYHLRDSNWQDRPKAAKAHWNAAKLYGKFYESFVDKFSGNSNEYFRFEYMFGFREATQEVIHELTGVNICCAGGTYIYCIPKTEIGYKIYDWILENCPCKHKILKKTVGTYYNYDVTTWAREMYRTRDDVRDLLKKSV